MPLHWSHRQRQWMERGGRVVSTVCEYCNEVVLREMVLKDGSQQMLRSTIDHILPMSDILSEKHMIGGTETPTLLDYATKFVRSLGITNFKAKIVDRPTREQMNHVRE